MKKVTKILMVVVLATISLQSFAQTFGIQAGLNMANFSMKAGGEDITDGKKMLMGFNFGITSESDINDALVIQIGLILHRKGVTFEGDPDDLKMSVMALDIPLDLKYKLDLAGNKLYFAAGPYVGFNISGKAKIGDEDESLGFGNDAAEDDLKSLDFGVNFGAGMEFGAIGVGVQYGLGLANLVPEGDSDNKTNNRVLSISLAYKFGQ